MGYPDVRPRRLRRTAALRRLVGETTFAPRDLVLPMFIREGLAEPRPIASLPGVVQHSRDSLRKAAVEAVQAGVGGLMLFGVPARRESLATRGGRGGSRRPAREGERYFPPRESLTVIGL